MSLIFATVSQDWINVWFTRWSLYNCSNCLLNTTGPVLFGIQDNSGIIESTIQFLCHSYPPWKYVLVHRTSLCRSVLLPLWSVPLGLQSINCSGSKWKPCCPLMLFSREGDWQPKSLFSSSICMLWYRSFWSRLLVYSLGIQWALSRIYVVEKNNRLQFYCNF